jgi:hypothetical protein
VTTISDDFINEKLKELRTPEAIVAYARSEGQTDEEIIKAMTINKSAKAVAAFAREYSKALGKSFAEIRRIAGPRS